MKVCSVCFKLKEASEYHKDKHGNLRPECKECGIKESGLFIEIVIDTVIQKLNKEST